MNLLGGRGCVGMSKVEEVKPEFGFSGGDEKIVKNPLYSTFNGKNTGKFKAGDNEVWVWSPVPRLYRFAIDYGDDYFEDFTSEHLDMISAKLRELNK